MKTQLTTGLLMAAFCLLGCSDPAAERTPPSQADFKKMKEAAEGSGGMGGGMGGGIGGAKGGDEGGFEVGSNFEDYDTNKDGQLTGEEIEEWMADADADKDKTITPEELKNWNELPITCRTRMYVVIQFLPHSL